MDCDDQIWVVKRYDDSYPLTPNMPCIAPLPVRSEIDTIWIFNQALGVGKRCAYLAISDATLSHMEIGVRDLRNRTASVIDAVKAGERVVLTVNGDPLADIVPHGQRTRWLGGAQLREQLRERAADPALRHELDELAGQTLDEL